MIIEKMFLKVIINSDWAKTVLDFRVLHDCRTFDYKHIYTHKQLSTLPQKAYPLWPQKTLQLKQNKTKLQMSIFRHFPESLVFVLYQVHYCHVTTGSYYNHYLKNTVWNLSEISAKPPSTTRILKSPIKKQGPLQQTLGVQSVLEEGWFIS